MKKALVCGAGGFIGGHLTKRLKSKGYWVRAVDMQSHTWTDLQADQFSLLDLRNYGDCLDALRGESFDEVYQLAADMGGMGFISSHDVECLTNSVAINLNMLRAAATIGVGKYFYSSSVCVYRDMAQGEGEIAEQDAYPARPDNEYGWEKLYSERLALAYSRRFDMPMRIARFQNCYGPHCAWDDGREKAPAALCRKAAESNEFIEVWGDGTAIRNFIYVDDLIDGIRVLMESGETQPANIGTDEYVTVDELARIAIELSGKSLEILHVPGSVGVAARNFSNARIKALGWLPRYSLRDGMAKLYPWIEKQVNR